MRLALAVLVALLLSSCGGSDDGPAPSPSAAVTSAVDAALRAESCPSLLRDKATQQENITEGKSVERSRARLAVITETIAAKSC